jgi:hypothetical protein
MMEVERERRRWRVSLMPMLLLAECVRISVPGTDIGGERSRGRAGNECDGGGGSARGSERGRRKRAMRPRRSDRARGGRGEDEAMWRVILASLVAVGV